MNGEFVIIVMHQQGYFFTNIFSSQWRIGNFEFLCGLGYLVLRRWYKVNEVDIRLVADAIPSNKAMLLQIYVAMKAMPWYSALPTLSEYMVENGWTRCFSRISDVSFFSYLGYMITYLMIVEFGIYWMHRELHDIKPLYKYLHATHHIYNKQNTLSPFAGNYSWSFPCLCLCGWHITTIS